MSQFRPVTLTEMQGGAMQEIFERELEKVLENIQDVNTGPKATRKITLEVEFKPNESRDIAECTIRAHSKLSPVRELMSTVYLDGNGKALEKVEDTGAINLSTKRGAM